MPGCRTRRSPPRPGSHPAPSARRSPGRGGDWWRPTRPEVRRRMSHVDEGTLHAYLDGALPPGERGQVDAHLAECPACRERLAEARALIARADALLALALPAERSAPPLHELRRRSMWRRVRWPIAWAATVTLAIGLGWMWRGREAREALVARAERGTLPQTVAVGPLREETRRPAAQERAPA